MANPNSRGRFPTLAAVARELDIPVASAYRMVRQCQLQAVNFGSKGFWRVERIVLDQYLADRGARLGGEGEIGSPKDQVGLRFQIVYLTLALQSLCATSQALTSH